MKIKKSGIIKKTWPRSPRPERKGKKMKTECRKSGKGRLDFITERVGTNKREKKTQSRTGNKGDARKRDIPANTGGTEVLLGSHTNRANTNQKGLTSASHLMRQFALRIGRTPPERIGEKMKTIFI